MMKLTKLAVSAWATLTLAGCASSGLNIVNHDDLERVETVAVAMYTVPKMIKADDRDAVEIDKDAEVELDPFAMAGSLFGGVIKKTIDFVDVDKLSQKVTPGSEAADITLPHFIAEMRKLKGWSFRTPKQVAENTEYQELNQALLQNEEIQLEVSSSRGASAASGQINLGLPLNHTANLDYYHNPDFKQWAADTAKALDVDAIILLQDTGFATDGQSLFSGANCFTKSAFHYAMFDKRGHMIAATRANFEESTIIPHGGCNDGAFPKTDYVNAFKQHGRDQAKAISDVLDL
jgi:hypothetical protein